MVIFPAITSDPPNCQVSLKVLNLICYILDIHQTSEVNLWDHFRQVTVVVEVTFVHAASVLVTFVKMFGPPILLTQN